jgi:hypothetical protein
VPAASKLTNNEQGSFARFRDFFTLLFPLLVILAVLGSKTGFSEHMRMYCQHSRSLLSQSQALLNEGT